MSGVRLFSFKTFSGDLALRHRHHTLPRPVPLSYPFPPTRRLPFPVSLLSLDSTLRPISSRALHPSNHYHLAP